MGNLIDRQELLNRTINNPLHPPYITERDVLNCPSAQPEVIACGSGELEQPECEDAVSRAAVEEMLKNGFPERGMWEVEGDIVRQTVCDTLVDALMDLEKLPSVTPKQPGWIPCKEQLPEKSGQYYVSGGDKVWICEFFIIPNFTGGWCNDAANPIVQAWMPLPEPYRG